MISRHLEVYWRINLPGYQKGKEADRLMIMHFFKILILQRYYNLSDDQIEYQINDRMSFMRFLDLTIADDIPDSKTVWKFREELIDLGLF